jgi:hypothetical protein
MNLDKNDFVPLNGMVLLEEVEPAPETETWDKAFGEPATKRKHTGPRYKVFKITKPGIDCKPRLKEAQGKYALVEAAMVEEFAFGDIKLKIVSESYVVGIWVSML